MLNDVVKRLRISDVSLLEGITRFLMRNIGNRVSLSAIKDGKPSYYQISATTLDDEGLRCELSPLMKIDDNYPKYLLPLDEIFADMNCGDIQKQNLLQWLLK